MKIQADLLSQQYLPLLSKQHSPLMSQQYLQISGGQGTLRSGMIKNQTSDDAMIEMLESVERTVYNHEMSHMVTGGGHSGAATYEYRRGPDGSIYVVAGGVSIDLTVTGSYDKVIEKMQAIKRSALSPASPSFQDFVVAAKAIHIENFEKSRKIFHDFINKKSDESTFSIYA